MRKLLWITLAAACCSCTMPSTVVRSAEPRPGLTLSGAPTGSYLVVDGKNVGPASSYDARPPSGGPRVLLVEPGTHDVEVVDGAGRVLFRTRVFVESETKTVEVH